MIRPQWWIAGLALWAGAAGAKASSRGSVGVEGRAFQPDDHDETEDQGLAVTGRLEWAHEHKPWREQVRLIGRAAAVDNDRSRVIVEEAWARYKSKYLRVLVGAQLLNWTATEAFHPADVVNSRNLDSNVENADKIGEPMAQLELRLGDIYASAYFMPLRMSPILPGGQSRLSFAPPGQAIGEPLWVDRNGDVNDDRVSPQWGARIATSIRGGDIALQYLEHNDRSQPTIVFDKTAFDETALDATVRGGGARPLYHRVSHFGLTWSQLIGETGLIAKLEAAHRRFDDAPSLDNLLPVGAASVPDHSQVAFGLEWGWGTDGGGDATVMLEGQSYFGLDERERRQLGLFQRDVLVGYRHAFNDVSGRELRVGLIVDAEAWPELLGNVHYRQRIDDTWSLEASLRVVYAPADPDSIRDASGQSTPEGLQALDEANDIQLTLTRHF